MSDSENDSDSSSSSGSSSASSSGSSTSSSNSSSPQQSPRLTPPKQDGPTSKSPEPQSIPTTPPEKAELLEPSSRKRSPSKTPEPKTPDTKCSIKNDSKHHTVQSPQCVADSSIESPKDPPESPRQQAAEIEQNVETTEAGRKRAHSPAEEVAEIPEKKTLRREKESPVEQIEKESPKTDIAQQKDAENDDSNSRVTETTRRDRSKSPSKNNARDKRRNEKSIDDRRRYSQSPRRDRRRTPDRRNRSRSPMRRRRSRSRDRSVDRRRRSRSPRRRSKSRSPRGRSRSPPPPRRRSRSPPPPRNQDAAKKDSTNDKKDDFPDPSVITRRQRRTVDLLTSKTGGAYIPPAKLRMLQAEITDKSTAAYQRIAWEALKKSIHGYINKVNVDNIGIITRELLKENIIRGRGLLCRSIIQAQAASPTFTHVYAALVAIINSKFPNIGELLLQRLVIQFKRGFRRNDKAICISSSRFIAHLVNQRVAHEILALEILTLLVETPTDDSVEVAIAFLKECGMKLTEVSSKGVNAIFEMLKNILHEGKLDKRVQYMIEVVFQVRKDGFKDHQSVIEALELVEEDEQFTHLIMLDEATETQDALNVFKFDDDFETNENKYKGLSRELLGSDASNSEGESGSGSDESGDDDDEEDAEQKADVIIDNTETNLVALRRTIYLTIHSSLDYEECAHKLMKMELKPGQEMELCHMFLDCCAEQRTYEKFYGLLAQRFCMINKMYVEPFEEIFRDTYHTTHRLDTNRLRNVSKFFAHLLFTDAIGWDVLECIQLNEDDTTSSSRIFIKILFQELAEYMGLSKLNEHLKDPTLGDSFAGLFPRDNPRNTRFAINFFTSIGLGGLTDELREFLKSVPKALPPIVNPEAIQVVDSSSSSSSSTSSSSSSDSSESSSSSDSSSDTSSSDSDSNKKSKKKQKGSKKQGKRKKLTKKKSKKSDSSASSSDDDSSDEEKEKSKKRKKKTVEKKKKADGEKGSRRDDNPFYDRRNQNERSRPVERDDWNRRAEKERARRDDQSDDQQRPSRSEDKRKDNRSGEDRYRGDDRDDSRRRDDRDDSRRRDDRDDSRRRDDRDDSRRRDDRDDSRRRDDRDDSRRRDDRDKRQDDRNGDKKKQRNKEEDSDYRRRNRKEDRHSPERRSKHDERTSTKGSEDSGKNRDRDESRSKHKARRGDSREG